MKQGFSFFDTTNESGLTLDNLEAKAVKLETVILNFFKANPNRLYTPVMIWQELGERYLIGSIRRAMTNLTPEHLTKTKVKKKEIFGGNNYHWTYVKPPYQSKIF